MNDLELLAHLEADPFHAAMPPADLPFEGVCDMLDQLFPSASAELSPLWALEASPG